MMMNKKKGTPEGAPITQLDFNTSAEKSHAQMLFDRIGYGSENAVQRPSGNADRTLRLMVAEANENGDCIVNLGFGYFRPKADEEELFNEYQHKELHRVRKIQAKIHSMRNAFYGGNKWE